MDKLASSLSPIFEKVEPAPGMKIDLRDSDYIWSSARILKAEKNKEAADASWVVTVRSDGWGEKWDEEVEWTSERIARLYTYTKKVKCFLSLFPKAKRKKRGPKAAVNDSTWWPCAVQFRMPHPHQKGGSDAEQCLEAEELLKLELNVYVLPYGRKYLPSYILVSLDEDGGRWFHKKRLRFWREDLTELGMLPKHFDKAFQEARNDATVPGELPSAALREGSLLDDAFRVRSVDGQNSLGILNATAPCLAKRVVERLQKPAPPTVVKVHSEVHPPDFPPHVRIDESIFPGVVRGSNEWIATVSLGGNDIFLGSFPTQSMARNAINMSTNQNGGTTVDEDTGDLEASKMADLRAVPIEAVVDAAEKQWNPSVSNFSLHEWTIQKIRHRAFLNNQMKARNDGKQELEQETEETKELDSTMLPRGAAERKNKRKQAQPRKVDMKARCYVP